VSLGARAKKIAQCSIKQSDFNGDFYCLIIFITFIVCVMSSRSGVVDLTIFLLQTLWIACCMCGGTESKIAFLMHFFLNGVRSLTFVLGILNFDKCFHFYSHYITSKVD
jgi:hypothetical protein